MEHRGDSAQSGFLLRRLGSKIVAGEAILASELFHLQVIVFHPFKELIASHSSGPFMTGLGDLRNLTNS